MMEISFRTDRNGGFGVFDEYNVSNSTDTAAPVTKPLILALCYQEISKRSLNIRSNTSMQKPNQTKPNETNNTKLKQTRISSREQSHRQFAVTRYTKILHIAQRSTTL